MPWQAKGGANTPPADDKKFEQLFAEVMGGAAPDASAGGGVDAGLDGAAVANGSDAPAPPPTLPAADPPAPTTDSVADSFFDPPASEGPQPSLPAAVTESPAALDWQPTRPAATPQPKPPARAGEPTRVATARPSPPGISDTLAGDPPSQRRPLPALPPTPVDIDNTRHLAWLLGSKVSLASLSHLAEAAPRGGQDWQLSALAEMLNITPPGDLAAQAAGASPERALSRMLKETRRLADELAPRHGDDHAALMEVAVKSNALVLIYERNRALAGPIKQAVASAATRADLPENAWKPLVELLDGSPSDRQVRAAVFRLHGDVERALREQVGTRATSSTGRSPW